MENFEKLTNENKFRWYMPDITFNDDERLAISSFTLVSSTIGITPINLRCSLINTNHLNSNGSILSYCMENGHISYQSRAAEFWPIDCSRPFYVEFTLEGALASEINFISLVLAVA